jgi:ketosteroid isomerase-like protein
MKKILIIITGFFFFHAASAQSKKEKQVAAAVEQLRIAMVDGNGKALNDLVMDQLSYGHSGGHIDDKKEFIEKLTSGKSDFVSIDLAEQTISISGKTAAVRHKLNAVTNDSGKPGEVHLLVLLIWQKTGGKWKLLARQAVKPS